MINSVSSVVSAANKGSQWRVRTASFITKVLAVSLLAVAPVAVLNAPAARAVAATPGLVCTGGGAADINVTASHGKAFPIDAQSNSDAAYIGYIISSSSLSRSKVWVQLSNFQSVTTGSASIVSSGETLAQIASATEPLTPSESRTAFFFLKALNISGFSNNSSQSGEFSHTVKVFAENPEITPSPTLLKECVYDFEIIQDGVQAATNSLSSVILSTTKPSLGETFTITASGNTGNIGAGDVPDNDFIWLSPTAKSSFPSTSLRLVATELTGSGCPTFRNQLKIVNANGSCYDSNNYSVKYVFKVYSVGPSGVVISPNATISSGKPSKLTTPFNTTPLDLTGATAASIQMQKGIESLTSTSDSVTIGSTNYARAFYVETATVIAGSGSLDFVVDSPTVGAIMDTTTVTFTDLSGANQAIVPVISGGKYFFSGPFTFSSSTPLVIRYSMLLPIDPGKSIRYENIVYGNIGGQQIYANGGIPVAAVIVDPDGTTTPETGFKLNKPGVSTKPASDITDVTAVINGTLEQKSETTTLYFDWGTDPTLGTSARINLGSTTTAPTDTSTTLNALTRDTTYYFRIIGVGDSGLTDTGTILNFHTGYVRAWTLDATNITFKKATLNGRYWDTQTSVSASANYKIFYGTNSSIDSLTATYVDLGTTNSPARTDVDTSTTLSVFDSNTVYYYRIIAFSSTGEQLAQGAVKSFTTGSVSTSAATSVTTTSATIRGSFTFGDDSATSMVVGFSYGTSSNLTTDSTTVLASESPANNDGNISKALAGLNANTKYYYRAFAYDGFETITAQILYFTTIALTPPPAAPLVLITWPNPAPINYPTPLSGTQLNANATCNGQPVTGTYVYNPVLGTILAPGTYTMQVTFIPNSSSACGATSTFVTIVVKAPAVTITWPNPPTAQGPATLGPNELNAVCSVPGKLVYDPAAGTVLPAGSYTLKVTCIPTDPNLPPVTTNVPFNVVNELAKITWPTPDPITGPLTLAPKQLNARCSVPGRIVYEPTLGTVLEPGTYTLTATCIPTNPKIPPVKTTVVLVVKGSVVAPKATTSPITFTKGTVSWEPVKYAMSYTVEIRGEQMCATTSTSCALDHTVGPKTPVIVTAIGDDKKTASARAVYFNDKLLPAIEVRFATGSFALDAKAQREIKRVSAIVKLEGFTIVEITGHTDPRGGALNVPLSNNRSNALKAAMLKLVPGLSIKNLGLSYQDPQATNKTASGMAANRRSVGAVK